MDSGTATDFTGRRPGLGVRFYVVFVFCIGVALFNFADAAHHPTAQAYVFGGLGAVGAIFLALIIWAMSRVKNAEANGYEALKPAIKAHVGVEPDFSGVMASGDALFIFLREARFYFAPADKPFDPDKVYGRDKVRSWQVEWTNAVNHSGAGRTSAVHRKDFRLTVRVQDLAQPAATIYCEDEKMAFWMEEAFTQMFGAPLSGVRA